MIKRIFSKRSGFTLVEILVAFAIFTIMMSMIMQILQLSVAARQQNTEMSRQRAAQEEQLILGKNYEFDEDAGETGKVGLKFDEDHEFELDYQIKGTDDDNPAEGLNYFIGDVDYDAAPVGADPKKKGTQSGSQMSKYDTRITGTADIGDIKLKVENNGGGRYTFTLEADATDNVSSEMQKYTQIRLYFYNDSKTYSDVNEYVDGYVETAEKKENGPDPEDIKTYKKCSVPVTASKVELVGGNSITDRISRDSNDWGSEKRILLQGLGNSVRISYYGGNTFTGTAIKFYVEFDEDPGLTSASFGDNGTSNGGYVTYSKYTVTDDEDNETEENNIYGAKTFAIRETSFSGSIWVAGVSDWDKNPGKNVKSLGGDT